MMADEVPAALQATIVVVAALALLYGLLTTLNEVHRFLEGLGWGRWRQFAERRHLWPFLILMRGFETVSLLGQRVRNRVHAAYRSIIASRVFWAVVASLLWWKALSELEPRHPAYALLAIPLIFAALYWPLSLFLQRVARQAREGLIERGLRGTVWIVAIVVFLALVILLPWRQDIPKDRATLGTIAVFLGMAFFGLAAALTLVGPIWIFWKSPLPPPQPKIGDARLADRNVLKAQGIIDER